MSRRDVMKRAGIIGVATIWATPIVQSVGAPAFAATGVCVPSDPSGCGGTCPGKCSLNLTCGTTTDCASGLTCTGTKCKVSDGASCQGTGTTADTNCASGKCGNGNPKLCLKSNGATCAVNGDCASGHCRVVSGSLVCTAV
jgi:hypothetical protein